MADSLALNVLDQVRIASPCSMNWDDMAGDGRVRHCGDCDLNVYNFAEMNEAEIVALVAETEGRVCGRLYRRADGTILTKDCPVGLRLVRQKMRRAAARIAAAVGLVMTGVWTAGCRSPVGSMGSVAIPPPAQPCDAPTCDVDQPTQPTTNDFLMGSLMMPLRDTVTDQPAPQTTNRPLMGRVAIPRRDPPLDNEDRPIPTTPDG